MKTKKFKVKVSYEEGRINSLDEQTICYSISRYLKELEKIEMLSNVTIQVKEKTK